MESTHITTAPGISWVKLSIAEAEYAWAKLEPMIARAVDLTDGDLTTEDVRMALLNDHMQAWVIYEENKIWAVCITMLVQDIHFRICRIVALSGEDFQRWKHLQGVIEAWARAMNCDYIDALTRPGMARKARPEGFRHKYSIIRKRVDKELH